MKKKIAIVMVIRLSLKSIKKKKFLSSWGGEGGDGYQKLLDITLSNINIPSRSESQFIIDGVGLTILSIY